MNIKRPVCAQNIENYLNVRVKGWMAHMHAETHARQNPDLNTAPITLRINTHGPLRLSLSLNKYLSLQLHTLHQP